MSLASGILPDDGFVFRKAFDISAPLNTSPAYPGDPDFKREWMARTEDGDGYSLSTLFICSHTATHIDFPCHMNSEAPCQDDYPPLRFILPAVVVLVQGEGPIMPCDLPDGCVRRGEALLFRSSNSSRGLMRRRDFKRDYVSLSPEAARVIADGGVSLVGVDYISVDGCGDPDLPVHRILLEGGVLILEGLQLGMVPEGRFLLICLPLKIEGAEATPVRAVLLR